jgi:regulator of cell morphogenesis and NO signaling
MNESEQISKGNISKQTVGELVAKDYRVSRIFESYGIDFCCGGNVALATVCREKGIDADELYGELAKMSDEPIDRGQNFGEWELSFLADYIVNTHHAYLKDETSAIAAYAHKIAQVHGEHHPEAVDIMQIFDKIAADLALHLHQEEELLFPAIKKMVALKQRGSELASKDVEALRSELKTLTHEHDEIGAAIHEIRRLSQDYTVPDDVCNTFMLTYKKLKEFEDDLHKHVHLENNILFPKAAKL